MSGAVGWVSEGDWAPLPPSASPRRHWQRARSRALWEMRGRPLRRLRADVAYARAAVRWARIEGQWFRYRASCVLAARVAGQAVPLRKRLVPRPRYVPRVLWDRVEGPILWAVLVRWSR